MNFSGPALFAGFVFGVFGAFLIKRGKIQAHLPTVMIGVLLLVYPYFFENIYLLWGVGTGLLFLAYQISET